MPPLPKPPHPRLLRPNLSPRYDHLHRRPHSTIPPQPSFLTRNRSPLIWSTLSLTFGLIAGSFVVHTIAPPPLPAIGSREDALLLGDLNRQIDEHFKVKVLRGRCLGVAKMLKGEEGGWFEVVEVPVALEELKGGEGKGKEEQHALIGHMRGAKGLGVERVFWGRETDTLVAVVWIGGSLCGWPGVTHGGAIATLLAEKLSLAATLGGENVADTLAAATPQRLPGTGNHAKMFAPAETPDEPKQLGFEYKKPTYANQFYIVRVAPALGEGKEGVEPLGGAEWEATLETVDGKVCVRARARFAASTVMQRVEGKIGGVVDGGYEAFREWMWPSRQKQSGSGR